MFYFYNNGNEELYMGSADWMPRNLDRRVEIIFPVLDTGIQKEVRHILQVELADNTKAHLMAADGIYNKLDKRGKVLVNSQQQFCDEAVSAVPDEEHRYTDRVFIPAEPVNSEEEEHE